MHGKPCRLQDIIKKPIDHLNNWNRKIDRTEIVYLSIYVEADDFGPLKRLARIIITSHEGPKAFISGLFISHNEVYMKF